MSSGIDLYWLPLGAGGWFVRLNGRVYEAARALLGCWSGGGRSVSTTRHWRCACPRDAS